MFLIIMMSSEYASCIAIELDAIIAVPSRACAEGVRVSAASSGSNVLVDWTLPRRRLVLALCLVTQTDVKEVCVPI